MAGGPFVASSSGEINMTDAEPRQRRKLERAPRKARLICRHPIPMASEYAFPDTAAKNAAGEFETEKMSISVRPSHPSTHGVLRIQLEPRR